MFDMSSTPNCYNFSSHNQSEFVGRPSLSSNDSAPVPILSHPFALAPCQEYHTSLRGPTLGRASASAISSSISAPHYPPLHLTYYNTATAASSQQSPLLNSAYVCQPFLSANQRMPVPIPQPWTRASYQQHPMPPCAPSFERTGTNTVSSSTSVSLSYAPGDWANRNFAATASPPSYLQSVPMRAASHGYLSSSFTSQPPSCAFYSQGPSRRTQFAPITAGGGHEDFNLSHGPPVDPNSGPSGTNSGPSGADVMARHFEKRRRHLAAILEEWDEKGASVRSESDEASTLGMQMPVVAPVRRWGLGYRPPSACALKRTRTVSVAACTACRVFLSDFDAAERHGNSSEHHQRVTCAVGDPRPPLRCALCQMSCVTATDLRLHFFKQHPKAARGLPTAVPANSAFSPIAKSGSSSHSSSSLSSTSPVAHAVRNVAKTCTRSAVMSWTPSRVVEWLVSLNRVLGSYSPVIVSQNITGAVG